MDSQSSSGARPVSRVLVLSDDNRLLLLRGKDLGEVPWWVSPGGGLRDAEDFASAAARELLEETGFIAGIGPCVWSWEHDFEWFGTKHRQMERFFVAWVGPARTPEPVAQDGYIIGYRWWRADEILESDHSFAPPNLGDLLPAVLRRAYPDVPIAIVGY